ncbi:hypothetical protein D9757_007170 [Collybiopsis confluens]|uniref:N-acetyltransferase domain-containing protein n=1 Tax=Collybiopsis confluens TaxID=2823264 RepID=A0A8H5M3Z9_9AGAR|nr:hypothetical protein D9757_007170 [Collybiopsis confluens]
MDDTSRNQSKLVGSTRTVELFSLTDGSITEKDVERMVDMSVKAFEGARDKDGDISHSALFGNNWSIAPSYFRHIIVVGLYADAVYGIRSKESKEIVAVGIWFGPNQRPDLTEEFKRKVGLYDFLDQLEAKFREWYTSSISKLIQERETFFTDDVCVLFSVACAANLVPDSLFFKERSRRWWCIHLCTDPEYHGQGLARSIIDYIHEKAQRTTHGGFVALAAAVEVNVHKYRTLGFRERGAVESPIPDSDKTIEMHILSRGA